MKLIERLVDNELLKARIGWDYKYRRRFKDDWTGDPQVEHTWFRLYVFVRFLGSWSFMYTGYWHTTHYEVF